MQIKIFKLLWIIEFFFKEEIKKDIIDYESVYLGYENKNKYFSIDECNILFIDNNQI